MGPAQAQIELVGKENQKMYQCLQNYVLSEPRATHDGADYLEGRRVLRFWRNARDPKTAEKTAVGTAVT